MTSWKSTLSGLVSAGASLIIALSSAGVAIPHWLVVTAGFVAAGGFAVLGVVSKDATVHSTVQEVNEATDKKV